MEILEQYAFWREKWYFFPSVIVWRAEGQQTPSDFQMKTGIGVVLQLQISSFQEAQFTVLSNGMLWKGVERGQMFQNRPHFASLARKGLRSWALVFFPWMLILQFEGRKEIVKSIQFSGSNLDCIYDMNSFYH